MADRDLLYRAAAVATILALVPAFLALRDDGPVRDDAAIGQPLSIAGSAAPATTAPTTGPTQVPATAAVEQEPSDNAPVQLTATPVPQAPPVPEPEPLEVLSVNVGPASTLNNVGPGLYELGYSSQLPIRYDWSTLTNYGQADSRDCTVVATTTDVSGGVLDVFRTASCSLDGWREIEAPVGAYTVTVDVRLVGGQTSSGTFAFSVLP